jgi:hypothetical protein
VVDEIDEHDAVLGHHTRQRDDTDSGHHDGEGCMHYEQPPEYST